MADDLRAEIAEVLAGHGAELAGGTNAGWYCCGNWSRPYGVGPDRAAAEHRQHVAEAILAAIGDRVLPEGGETREDAGHWSPNRAYVWACGGGGTTREDCESFAASDPRHPPVSHVMTVTSWPDGSTHYGPWRPVDDDPKES